MDAYLIDAQQSAKQSVVFLAEVLHFTVSCMCVTFRSIDLLLNVVVACSGIDCISGLCQFIAQAIVVLKGEETRAVARLDISAQHLHFFGCHLERAQRSNRMVRLPERVALR